MFTVCERVCERVWECLNISVWRHVYGHMKCVYVLFYTEFGHVVGGGVGSPVSTHVVEFATVTAANPLAVSHDAQFHPMKPCVVEACKNTVSFTFTSSH